MSFGLRNTGATYHILVDKIFEQQIGRNIELYFDDMVIKSKSDDDFMKDRGDSKTTNTNQYETQP